MCPGVGAGAGGLRGSLLDFISFSSSLALGYFVLAWGWFFWVLDFIHGGGLSVTKVVEREN